MAAPSVAGPKAVASVDDVTYLGADARKGGWAVVVMDDNGWVDLFAASSIADAEATGIERYGAEVLVVDIPIGIPDNGPRLADSLARKFIGPRRSSVFSTPVRAALEAETYEEARAASVIATGGKSLSAQAYAIRERILDANGHVPHARIDVSEGHPEVSFRAMAGEGLDHAKKTFAGLSLRYDLLRAEGIDVPQSIERTIRGAATDDVLDAAAMAWTARRVARGDAERFPTGAESQVFSDGIDSAIWF